MQLVNTECLNLRKRVRIELLLLYCKCHSVVLLDHSHQIKKTKPKSKRETWNHIVQFQSEQKQKQYKTSQTFFFFQKESGFIFCEQKVPGCGEVGGQQAISDGKL